MKFLTLCALLGCNSLGPADLKGHVSLSDGRPGAYAVITLDAGGQHAKAPTHGVIDQRNKTFLPHVLAVPVGSTVDFPNNDMVFHNVFAEFDAKRFDLGMYPRGAKKKQTFNKPGIVALFCSVHSDMSAFVYVTNAPYFVVADTRGNFDLKGVPVGHYSLAVWHESGQSVKKEIAVDTPNAAVDLTLRRG